jgi:hypothetical protein
VGKSGANFEVGPTLVETIVRGGSRYEECVFINVIDLRECFDEVNGVAFVSTELRPN